MKNTTSLQFVNHASVLVSHGEISLLSDPWYQGDAFHKGWSLIHELSDEEVLKLLTKVTHIWISHEHPDHFSIMFFKKFGEEIQNRNIQIIFQDTKDKRVENFLLKSGYDLKIITFNSWLKLSEEFEILCFKDGFYDSGLAIKTSDKTILNFNDCEIKNKSRCEEVLKITGECDILVSQFSYAAWKGGKENAAWRKLAAKEKLETLLLQANYFKPKVLVPFASYVFFSNNSNFYLNDAANKPQDVIDAFNKNPTKVRIMKPFQVLDDLDIEINNSDALKFWSDAYQISSNSILQKYETIDLASIQSSYEKYRSRVFANNTKWFMRLIRYISPISAFKPINIRINDLNMVIKFDLFHNSIRKSDNDADISMASESIDFILKNSFGFDTLTVNGCFEEETKGGFSRAARTLAIENLNNMGIEFRPAIIFNYQLIKMFISRLLTVSRKIKLSSKPT